MHSIATAAMMVQENWDESVQTDVVNFLRQIIPKGVWLHDQQDGNGDSHLKAGLVGPSETIPVIDGKLGLSTWQNIFLCEFDGPRSVRQGGLHCTKWRWEIKRSKTLNFIYRIKRLERHRFHLT